MTKSSERPLIPEQPPTEGVDVIDTGGSQQPPTSSGDSQQPATNSTEMVVKTTCEPVPQKSRDQMLTEVEQQFCGVTGVKATDVATRLNWQMGSTQRDPGDSAGTILSAGFQMMAELKPADAIESMLAIQMSAVHEASLQFLGLATLDEQTFEARDANVLRAARLMRIFIDQLSAMQKLKGKTGRQKVTVEHVHVHAGGQAIVGAVTAKAERRELTSGRD